MRDIKDLQAYWRLHRGEPLMICTIIGKTGSGYRGVGAKKIIRRNGESCGMLSGGCLEGDIIATAIEAWGQPAFPKSFSTMSEEDRLLGYQTGCAGLIEILFEPLPETLDRLMEILPYAPLNLYIIGCGPNARPFAELAPPLGWGVTFLDYRQGYILDGYPSIRSEVVPIDTMGREIAASGRTAVVLMTHNYEADLAIMAQLNGRDFFYLGCVGPRRRFEQMQDDLQKFHHIAMDAGWAARVHAPAGLKQGHTPEEIAFSIIAEIQFSLGNEES